MAEGEKLALSQLVFYLIEKIEAMSDRAVRTMGSAQKDRHLTRMAGGVEPNTAVKTLVQIADFLLWHHEKVLNPRMPLDSPVTIRCCGRRDFSPAG